MSRSATPLRVLLVKMSSLGDVVHALPAVTDAAAHGVVFDWVVEEAFAAIPARHPAVRRVLPIAWRRWRRAVGEHRRELGGFIRDLRRERYDLVLDAQGLWKSALVTGLARGGKRAGLSWSSAREAPASLFYGRRVAVATGLHAVERLRRLFAGAVGYPYPSGPERFGLETSRPVHGGDPAPGECLLLHGTTWATKHWPESMWAALARRLAADGYRVLLPWGSEAERARAARIAHGVPGTAVLGAMSLDALMERLAGAALVVGVDSGLSHLAGALGVPTVVLYGSTDPALTGCRGRRVCNLAAEFPCAPCLERSCRYSGPDQVWQGERVSPACYARLTPEHVWPAIVQLLKS